MNPTENTSPRERLVLAVRAATLATNQARVLYGRCSARADAAQATEDKARVELLDFDHVEFLAALASSRDVAS